MRDPARIPRILALLSDVWTKSPDLRLGQLLEASRQYSHHTWSAAFQVEDDVTEDGLRRFAEKAEPWWTPEVKS